MVSVNVQVLLANDGFFQSTFQCNQEGVGNHDGFSYPDSEIVCMTSTGGAGVLMTLPDRNCSGVEAESSPKEPLGTTLVSLPSNR